MLEHDIFKLVKDISTCPRAVALIDRPLKWSHVAAVAAALRLRQLHRAFTSLPLFGILALN